MCMFDDSEQFDWFRDKTRRAARTHTCIECGRQIQPGEHYEYGVGMYDGSFEMFKTCAHCVVARRWLSVVCSGWMYHAVQEDLWEHVGGEEAELRSPPLTRLYRWMRADWKTRQGELRPLEDVEAVTEQAIEAWRRLLASRTAA